jgi:hypothetical protein
MTQTNRNPKSTGSIKEDNAVVSFLRTHCKTLLAAVCCVLLAVGVVFYLPIPGLAGSGGMMGDGISGNIIPPEPPYDQYPMPTSVPVYKIIDYVDVRLDLQDPQHPPHAVSSNIDDFPNEAAMYALIEAWLHEHHLPVPADRFSPPGARWVSPLVSWDGDVISTGPNNEKLYYERGLFYHQYLESKYLVWPSKIRAGVWQHGDRDYISVIWVWVEKVGDVTLISPKDAYHNLKEHNRDIGFVEQIAPHMTAWGHIRFDDIAFNYRYNDKHLAAGTQQYLIPAWTFGHLDERTPIHATASAVDSDKDFSYGWHPQAFSWTPENYPGFIPNERFDALKNTKTKRWVEGWASKPTIPRESFEQMNHIYYT